MPHISQAVSSTHQAVVDAASSSSWLPRLIASSLQRKIGAPLPAVPHNIDNICPITREPIGSLDDLVMADDHYLYDRGALKQMLALSPLSPMSRQLMPKVSAELIGFVAKRTPAPGEAGARLSLTQMVALYTTAVLSLGTLAGSAGGLALGQRLLRPRHARADRVEAFVLNLACATLGAAGGALTGAGYLVAGFWGLDSYLCSLQDNAEAPA